MVEGECDLEGGGVGDECFLEEGFEFGEDVVVGRVGVPDAEEEEGSGRAVDADGLLLEEEGFGVGPGDGVDVFVVEMSDFVEEVAAVEEELGERGKAALEFTDLVAHFIND